MNFSPEAIAVITGLGVTISGLATAFYKHLLKQLDDCTTAKATLETEAKEMAKAKDAEKDEWRRMAMANNNRETTP